MTALLNTELMSVQNIGCASHWQNLTLGHRPDKLSLRHLRQEQSRLTGQHFPVTFKIRVIQHCQTDVKLKTSRGAVQVLTLPTLNMDCILLLSSKVVLINEDR